ncbi:uncharacterized protein TRIVIDRAFT_191091 [Trichoderma virens Gv29-8]|uniref:EKC/KEOPS complex subunit BUD32 n=1 Tax=Hypocrea virens (strain Gv29-8 / FGSC 10586) TaxID=413071 RepID=G9MT06_HYPVG|nr:uncharacterized protein TRIVIDRAFT_191091 [Trichoderma virens Gv29-8]EHK22262.1 hypothetical protein TRIVIDRAFT_191091 [Trichoderma virens Gv29-8]
MLHLVRGGTGLDRFRPLIRHIGENSRDELIWIEVFDLIDTFSELTPPSSIIKLQEALKATHAKSSSSRRTGSETGYIDDVELFEEIKECTFRNVGGFWDKFFDSNGWSEEHQTMLQAVMAEHDGKKWTGFPSVSDEEPVWDWLRSLEDRFLADAPYKLRTTTTANQFKEQKGQMDLFFQTPAAAANSIFEYKDALVAGQQKKLYDSGEFKADFLQLARHVRGLFIDYPTRRFAHGFTLCASTMELWVFDRSGAYSSGPFDIHDEPDKIARALVGYSTMDDNAMGLDTFTERKDDRHYVTLDGGDSTEMRVRLVRPIVRRNAIVSRGTTCFQTRNGHVAKFSWVPDKRNAEVENLKLAERRGVRGVARVVAYRQITTIAELREGLQFPEHHRFQTEDVEFNDPAPVSIQTTRQKRELGSEHTSGDSPISKRLRFGSARSKLVTAVDNQQSVDQTKLSLHTPCEDLWENRIYSCLVVSPAGRVISSFNTIKELLESLRDAIKAHQSLYTRGNILHRDISSNNIIITKPETEDGFKGMLIDLDLASVRDSDTSGAQHRVGTMRFMAIEVLSKVDHTYRHDLESFFYVLIWMCARESWTKDFTRGESPPQGSSLHQWETGSFTTIADAKSFHMSKNGMDRIVREFPEAMDIVKPLCMKIRKILFPMDMEGGVNYGTPAGDPDQLYGPIIEAYDGTISCL